jgi:hypothetical protein
MLAFCEANPQPSDAGGTIEVAMADFGERARTDIVLHASLAI